MSMLVEDYKNCQSKLKSIFLNRTTNVISNLATLNAKSQNNEKEGKERRFIHSFYCDNSKTRRDCVKKIFGCES